MIVVLVVPMIKIEKLMYVSGSVVCLTVTPGVSDTPSSQENFGFGRNLVQVDSIPTQVTTT